MTAVGLSVLFCVVTDVVIALRPLHGLAPPDEEEDKQL